MELLNVRVQDIPVSNEGKTPDFEFWCKDECSLVELKRRDSSVHFTEEENQALDIGAIIDRNEGIGFHDTISNRVRDARKQLSEFQTERHAFRLVWFCTYGEFRELAAQQIRATLLGDITIFEKNSERQWRAYFFDHNYFHRYRDSIDGAIVSQMETVQLILNPFSPRYDRFIDSNIVNAFSAGLLDPLKLECDGEAVIVGPSADRTSEEGKLDYLANTYGINDPFIIRMGHYAAFMRRQ